MLLSLTFLWLLASTGSAAALPAGQGARRAEILRLVNGVRAAHGLFAFTPNPALAAAAQSQAEYLAATGTYVHSGWGGSTPASRARAAGYVGFVSENVVGGSELSPTEGVIWWQNSPIHLAAMVSSRYVDAGAGYAFGHDQHFYTLVVGRPPAGGAAPDPTDDTDNSAAPIFVTPIILAAPDEKGGIVHVVQPGQTAWAIAARYNVPLPTILLYNSLEPNHTLLPGDELIIRLGEGQLPPPTPTPPFSHIVQAGQTAWTIAAIYDLSLADLLWMNGLGPEAIIQPGEEILIRLVPGQQPPPTATPQLTHIVQAGETAWAIAARHDLSLAEILTWNGLTADALIIPGDELRIFPPPTVTPPPPTATPTVVATVVFPTETRAVPVTPTAALTPTAAAALATPTRMIAAETRPRETAVGQENSDGLFMALGAGFILLMGGLVYYGGRRGWL